MRSLLLIPLCLTLSLRADGLSDVRTALAALPAQTPIRATYEVNRAVDNQGRFANNKFRGHASVELEGDAGGVRVLYSKPLLEQVEKEQHAKSRDPKTQTPAASALGTITPMVAADAIDFAPALVQLLSDAKLLEDRGGTFQGKPARISSSASPTNAKSTSAR